MEKELKKIILLFLSLILINPANAADIQNNNTAVESESDWKPVINAIIQVESGGNEKATHGASVGAMQITPLLVAECNNILKSRKSKKRFKLSDRFNLQKSIEMFLLIQSRYNPKNDIERAIRSWNGGIHYSAKRTQRYFEKVMKALRNN